MILLPEIPFNQEKVIEDIRREYTAQQALDMDLVTGIEDDVVAAAQTMGEHMSTFEPYAMTASKRLLNASLNSSLDAQLNAEATAQVLGFFTDTAQALGQQSS